MLPLTANTLSAHIPFSSLREQIEDELFQAHMLSFINALII